MLHSNQPIIKHKVGLLNLAEELNQVSKACKLMGDFATLKLRNRQIDHAYTPPKSIAHLALLPLDNLQKGSLVYSSRLG